MMGMGAVYQVTHDLLPLRRDLMPMERAELLERWYRPHHQVLTHAVDRCLKEYGQALVIDAHSFPSCPLPNEKDAMALRLEICVGHRPFLHA